MVYIKINQDNSVVLGSTIEPLESGWQIYEGEIPQAGRHVWDEETQSVLVCPQWQAEQRTLLADKAKSEYEASIQAIIGQTPMTEIATWDKQEAEARAILADETAVTPLIDALVTARNLGETRVELATKIVNNADAYAVATGQLLGHYQAKLKEIV